MEGLILLSDVADALIDALGDRLGTYTFPGVGTAPAIRPDDGSNPYAQEPSVEGLEVILVRSAEIPLSPMLANCWQQSITTLIILKQWDIAKNAVEEFDACWRAIARLGLQPAQPVRTVRTTRLDNIETIRFQYTEQLVIGL